jgi:hypothetical protein
MRELEQDELNFVAGADGNDGPPHTNDPEVMEPYVEGILGGQWKCTSSGPDAWSCVRESQVEQQDQAPNP